MLTIVALAVGQTAWATSSFTVSNPTGSTFRITRTGNTSVSETINWRVVSLSAIEGIHYNGVQGGVAGVYNGSVTFTANDTYKEVTINELTPSTGAYMYQNANRSYRFEVLDKDGYIMAHTDRTITKGSTFTFNGTNVNSSIPNNSFVFLNGSPAKLVHLDIKPQTEVVKLEIHHMLAASPPNWDGEVGSPELDMFFENMGDE